LKHFCGKNFHLGSFDHIAQLIKLAALHILSGKPFTIIYGTGFLVIFVISDVPPIVTEVAYKANIRSVISKCRLIGSVMNVDSWTSGTPGNGFNTTATNFPPSPITDLSGRKRIHNCRPLSSSGNRVFENFLFLISGKLSDKEFLTFLSNIFRPKGYCATFNTE
jgi:hypothetical protein